MSTDRHPTHNKGSLHLKEISTCEVCDARHLKPVLNLGQHPLCDDLVPVGEGRICTEYPIQILFCETCMTAHQRFQIPRHELFPMTYHYRSRHTADVVNGMRSLVKVCEKYGLNNKKVLDIGCNDGSLLNIFAEKKAITFGIEPTGAYQEAEKSGHQIINAFFCEALAHRIVQQYGQFDVITFTNVFAHVENLADIIRGLKVIMHSQSVLVIENHYLGTILEKFQFDTFYHEHSRTYSYTSFIFIARQLDRKIGSVDFPPRYNGNIRIVIIPNDSQQTPATENQILAQEKNYEPRLFKMQDKLNEWRQKTNAYIKAQIAQHGKLSAKAFPGRAAISVKLLGLDETHIKAVYEKPLSAKINHYVPGTRIPILPDTDLSLTETTSPLINLAWHISDEIRLYMQELGYTGKIVDLVSTKDFEEA